MLISNKSRAAGRIIGLDIGRRWVCMVALSRNRRGEVRLQGGACTELPEGVNHADVLRQVCAGDAMVQCNLGDASVIIQETSFPQMAEEDLRSAAAIEAAQLIPDVDSMVVDLQVLGISSNGKDEARVMIVAAPKAAVASRSKTLAEAEVNVAAVIPDGLALANAVLALCPPQEEVILVINVDEEMTHLVGVAPVECLLAPLVRKIPGGMNLHLSASGNGDDSAQSHRSRSADMERWLREVERSIDFATNKLGRPVSRMLVTGSAAVSEEAIESLSQRLSIPISGWNPLQSLRRGSGAPDESFAEKYGSRAAVAVGLALTEGN